MREAPDVVADWLYLALADVDQVEVERTTRTSVSVHAGNALLTLAARETDTGPVVRIDGVTAAEAVAALDRVLDQAGGRFLP